MDNNNPSTGSGQVPGQTVQPQAVNPVPQNIGMSNTAAAGMPPVTPQPVPSSSGGGSKKMLFIIIFAFLIVGGLLALGIFMYMRAQQTNPELQQVSDGISESFKALEQDLSTLDLGTVEADFEEVDSDLKQL